MKKAFSKHPSICTSIPAINEEYLINSINKAINKGSDYLEIRFDYLSSIDTLRIEKLIGKHSDKCIYTFRKKNEGGQFIGKEDERIKILTNLALMEPKFIDVELNTIKKSQELQSILKTIGSEVIISWHNYFYTPKIDYLQKILKEAQSFGQIVKITTKANNFSDNSRILSLYKINSNEKLIAFCMGEIGIISRLLCALLGSPITYACLDKEKTAPGQIPISEMIEFYDSFENSN